MKVYAYIFENYCAKELQIALKELPNYESDVVNNPINLLKEVRGLMHTPIKARYPFMSLTENLSNLLNIKQTENESLIEYLERFEQDKGIMKSQLGVTVLDKFMETYPTYSDADADGQAKLKSAAFEAWMAAVFLRGSNQSIYGELMRDYRKDFANQDDNYPKSVRAMVDVMRQLKPNKKK